MKPDDLARRSVERARFPRQLSGAEQIDALDNWLMSNPDADRKLWQTLDPFNAAEMAGLPQTVRAMLNDPHWRRTLHRLADEHSQNTVTGSTAGGL